MIREATEADIPEISEIYSDAVLNGTASYELDVPTIAEMKVRYDVLRSGGFPYLVSVDADGAILGYAYAGPFRTRLAYRFIVEDSVYVSPTAKGRGVGLELMRSLIENVQKLGFRQIVAVIGDGSPDSPSVRLHEKTGFRHCGVLQGSGYKHDRWLDTVFMQLELNGGATCAPDVDSLPEREFRAKA